jgi:polyisoprenoid-binding protein YceI
MNNFKTIAIALFTIGTLAVSAQTKKVDVNKSTIKWIGKKVTGQHNGEVKLQDGALVFKAGKIAGGSFTVDMASIEVTDLKAGQGKEKLEGHLKNDDFFATEKYPTATLDFKSIATKKNNIYTVTADLTVKGKTAPVVFYLVVAGNSATTKFNIDRTKYDVKYGSGSFFQGLGDKTIDDNFEISAVLVW